MADLQTLPLLGEQPKPAAVDPKYRGTKTYRLTQRHYRLGRVFEVGELITVTDEVPGRTWDLVDDKAPAPAAPPAQPKPGPARASDKSL